MKKLFCFECQKLYVKKHGTVKMSHPEIGEFEVDNLLYMLCEECGDRVILPEQAERVHIIQTKLRIKSFLSKTPEKFNSTAISDELQVDILTTEKALIELINDKDIVFTNVKMRAGERKFYSAQLKSFWAKLKNKMVSL